MNDKQLIRFAKSFRTGIIGRKAGDYACFMVCAPLAPLLRHSGVKAEMRDGWIALDVGSINHYWIELADGRVLDPTAEQFNKRLGLDLPRVYLGPPTQIHPNGQETKGCDNG